MGNCAQSQVRNIETSVVFRTSSITPEKVIRQKGEVHYLYHGSEHWRAILCL